MRFLIFATLFTTVQVLLTLYISKRFVKRAHFSSRTKKLFNIFLALNLIGIIGYLFARYNPMIPNWLYFMLSIPIGLIFVLFAITLIYDLSHALVNVGIKDPNRRAFFKKGLDLTTVTAATAVTGKAMLNAKNYQVEPVDILIKDLKKEYTIAQLSDVHIGGLIDQSFIKSMVQKVNSLEVDVIVITGDLIDTGLNYAAAALNELQHLKAKYGVYFIVGNHEYFHQIEPIINYVKALGIKVLENEAVYIGKRGQGFNLAGVYDVFGYRYGSYQPDIKKALSKLEPSPTILLAHQPKFIEEVPQSVDLLLSGHTHGGQIMPFNLLVKLQQPYVKGLHWHNKKTQIYVNKGTGFWGPPMRLGASSEITHIQLKRSE